VRKKRNAYRILVGEAGRMRPLRRRGRRRGKIMDLREIGWDGMDWIELAQDRGKWWALVITVLNLQVP
jgi:hypothetical protein